MRLLLLLVPSLLLAQVTEADYQRALGLRTKLRSLAVGLPEAPHAIAGTHRFWYRISVAGGNEFVLLDADTREKKPAFDHKKLAAFLSATSGAAYTAVTLPFDLITFADHETALRFEAAGFGWKCSLDDYRCQKTGTAPGSLVRRDPPGGEDESPAEPDNDVADGVEDAPQEEAAEATADRTPEVRISPDQKWEALIRNYNVFLRAKGEKSAAPLSFDGSEGNYYTLHSIEWSPDSRRLVAYRVRPGYRREVHYIESSPRDQLQPKHSSRQYAKPGDVLDVAQPVLFDLTAKKQIEIHPDLFPNPYSLSRAQWRKDSRAFTFEYNQRGHQVYRVIEVRAAGGEARALIREESRTFIDYRPLAANARETGKHFLYDCNDGREIIWASERDGWNHLYLYDGVTGKVKQQITRGNWVVRGVDKIDEEKRQIWFQASGMYPGKDPYFLHAYRINFDGTGLVALTEADANHSIAYSSDMKYYVDTFSRVDLPPVSELRTTADRKLVTQVERANMEALSAAGWHPPEVFTAPGRDGKTEIWGVIYLPPHLDPAKKYAVVESIYAGPQGSFVQKTFTPVAQTLTELGFIVVQIDGMGTNNRSRAFHDVAWKNLGDAGLPDRILWHKAVAAKYPYYDISRVGVYGNSAGGQNALGALLFHPEFYKAAVANSGCHDNRMDKIWWNELWMGWPLGPHYAASSNVDNAYRLQGKLLLIVGEMDTNVDPASTLQVVNALIRANKKFDLLFVPGGGHGAGGAFGRRLLCDFFVHNLLGEEPPDWNQGVTAP